jgi:hypothetical protein
MTDLVESSADISDTTAACITIVLGSKLGYVMNRGDFLSRQVILSLEVLLGDLDIAHGHSDVSVAEDLFQGSEADAGPQHHRGIGMSELVKPNGRATSTFCRILECFADVSGGVKMHQNRRFEDAGRGDVALPPAPSKFD